MYGALLVAMLVVYGLGATELCSYAILTAAFGRSSRCRCTTSTYTVARPDTNWSKRARDLARCCFPGVMSGFPCTSYHLTHYGSIRTE